MAKARNDARPIIIKKVKKVVGGHHGGAWKVAYADFVTAMMAFFMLLWLLTVSDKVTLQGVADYFTPSNATMSNSSGSGKILAGTALEKDGAKSSGSVSLSTAEAVKASKTDTVAERDKADVKQSSTWESKLPSQGDTQLLQAEEALRTAIQDVPALRDNRDQIIVEQTPDGLRVQLVDKDQRPMFRNGTAELFPFAARMIEAVGDVIERMTNRISIQGHTDSSGEQSAAAYGNWELSADRANATRRVLVSAGVRVDRLAEVVGRASSDPLYPDDRFRPENRRMTILVLREPPVVDPDFGEK